MQRLSKLIGLGARWQRQEAHVSEHSSTDDTHGTVGPHVDAYTGSEANVHAAGRIGSDVAPSASHRGNRGWWTAEAETYYGEHGDFLGDDELVWGPEGARESELHLLGDLAGRTVLEFGSGAAQGARYVASCGARVVGSDLAEGMLTVAQRIDARRCAADQRAAPVPLVQADAVSLPFADAAFDVVFSAYGATPFVADLPRMLGECARVLRPGGRLVYSTSHPIRWAFPDGPEALEATMNYFDRTPYVERSGGRVEYAEYHRTLGDHVRALTGAGFRLVDLVEPEWPSWNDQTWGGWSPVRGAHIPGTAIFVAVREHDGFTCDSVGTRA